MDKNSLTETHHLKINTGQKILNAPLTRIIIGLFVCIGTVRLGQIAIHKLLELTVMDKDLKSLIGGIAVALIAITSYCYLFRFYEKRSIDEFARKNALKNIFIGAVIGAVLQCLTILVIFLKGGYSIVSVNPIWYVLPPLIMAFTSAIVEEVLLRGIIFRISEQVLGSYFAMVISAVLFGAMHLANPNSSLIAGIRLAIQAGLLLAAAYIYKRSLWFPIAIHFAWNFMQSAIFGANVSGNTVSRTLITSKIEGAQWLTGGQFGPEGSIQATLFCSIATIILLVLSCKEGKFVKPYWSKTVDRKQKLVKPECITALN